MVPILKLSHAELIPCAWEHVDAFTHGICLDAIAASTPAIPYPMTAEKARRWLELYMRGNQRPDTYHWSVFSNHHSTYIGMCSLYPHRLDPVQPELGIWLVPDFWGSGIGSSCVSRLVEFAREHRIWNCLYACFLDDNQAAKSIFHRHQFQPLDHRMRKHAYFGRSAKELRFCLSLHKR